MKKFKTHDGYEVKVGDILYIVDYWVNSPCIFKIKCTEIIPLTRERDYTRVVGDFIGNILQNKKHHTNRSVSNKTCYDSDSDTEFLFKNSHNAIDKLKSLLDKTEKSNIKDFERRQKEILLLKKKLQKLKERFHYDI